MNRLMTLAATALASSMAQAATPVLIDFETPTSFESILSYYDGGTDSAGASGPALGVQFGVDALALQNDVLGPYFSNAPSALGVMAPVGADATMNVAAGFTGSISLWYSADTFVAQGVNVWSGLDGTGTLLASLNLVGNAQFGCSDSPYCRFDRLDAGFFGTARSVTFGNAAGAAAFDNISISAVPEPASIALLAMGLALVSLAARRR